jgi:alpha-beta hydrolase superfamily lysophospholipase
MPSGGPIDRRAQPVSLTSRDGLRLAGTSFLPRSPRADVVIVHGYAEHSERYGALVDALLEHGYGCHLLDLRGHGASEGPRGHTPRFAAYRDDLARFLERVPPPTAPKPVPAPEAPKPVKTRPTVLFGHSLGGLICLDFLLAGGSTSTRFAALALSSPYMAPDLPCVPCVHVLARLLALVAPTLRLPFGPKPEGLSRDPEVVAAYVADPRVVRTVTPGWASAVLDAQRRVLERAGEITLPTLVLAGSEDPIAAPERTRELFERLGGDDKHLEVYDGFLHEVLNERGRERVVEDLVSWLESRV